MAVPTELEAAVDRLRAMGAASSTDVFDTITYWTDDQLLEILIPFVEYPEYTLWAVDKNDKIFRYNSAIAHYIDTSTVVFTGTELTPTYDVARRTLTFASAITSTITFTAAMYNLNRAAAELWGRKASQRYDLIRVKAGANQLFLEQEYAHCVARQAYYNNLSIVFHKRAGGW